MRTQIIALLALVLGLGFGTGVEAQSKKASRKKVSTSKTQKAHETLLDEGVIYQFVETPDVLLRGSLPDSSFNGEDVFLVRTRETGVDTIAKAPIKGDSFIFGVFFGQDTTAMVDLTFKRKFHTAVVLEKGRVFADMSTASATGTPLNDRLAKLMRDAKALEEEVTKAFESSTDNEESNKIYKKFEADRIKLYAEAFEANPNNVVGAHAGTRLFNTHIGATPEQIAKWRNLAGPAVLNSPLVSRALKNLDAEIATSAGKPFIDVQGKDDNEQPSKLSDFAGRGHYTLVDFWASWCGPCRRAMPGLKNIYAKYKDKGLQIVGLAVWDKWQSHLDAVKKDELPWPQIFNETEATDAYGVTGIPEILLIGPDGKIVARKLHGEENITALLEGILQKEGKL